MNVRDNAGGYPRCLVDLDTSLPIPVTVVGSHACYPRECRAHGLLFSGKRVVIDYPFKWLQKPNDPFESDAPVNVIDVRLLDGDERVAGWQYVSVSELSVDDFRALICHIDSIMPATSCSEDRAAMALKITGILTNIADAAPWEIDPGTDQIFSRELQSSE
jgi:hypothetical protein